jgi:uncharacterized protein involved in exopolysaccharide biosynthesis
MNEIKMEPGAEIITFPEIKSVIKINLWKIVLLSSIVGFSTAIWMFMKPNLYQASAILAPIGEESKPSSALGALASFGIPVGSSSKLEELEALFRSDDLTVRIFRKHNLWPIVFRDYFDPTTGKLKICWVDRLLFGRGKTEVPSDWDAIRSAGKSFKVSTNKKIGTLFIAFETLNPAASADIVRYYLDESKSRLQEEALERATTNKRFLEEQIGKSMDPLSRERMYVVYGQEVEREMMARNREQFGFKVIDAPRVPDRKSSPERAWNITVASFLAFLAGCAYFLVRRRKI